jgi:hypothetical protein
MIYCEKRQNYVDQEITCLLCVFYKRKEDSCFYSKWNPGLKKGRKIKEIEHD